MDSVADEGSELFEEEVVVNVAEALVIMLLMLLV